ncbi:MAG TPA: SDR family oxidoreductase [Dongiaceae bacterium]|nr:SDR family oxidoreductase [Dongiaceae bacterium]
MSELNGKVAVVTGSARNIGRAIALALARAGAAVVINAQKSGEEAKATADAITAEGGRAIVQLADVTQEEDSAALVDAALKAFGRLDCLVNNAAVRRETPFAEMTLADWRAVNSIILDGAFLMAKAALPALQRSGEGSIVNIGGMSAHTGAMNRAHVVTAKAGLVGFTRALAHDLAADRITVNCVVPGMIETQRGKSSAAAPAHHAGHMPLIGRRGTPEEIAALVRFLAGPQARYITGQTIHANGGVFMP